MANQKISEYLNTRNTFDDGDLFDVSAFLNPGYETQKTTYAIFKANLVSAGFLSSGDNVSELTNDAGYLTSIPASYLQSGDNVSELVNDAGYLTSGDGNGIYTGSGIVPSGTIATISDEIEFASNTTAVTGIELKQSNIAGQNRIYLRDNNNDACIQMHNFNSGLTIAGSYADTAGFTSINKKTVHLFLGNGNTSTDVYTLSTSPNTGFAGLVDRMTMNGNGEFIFGTGSPNASVRMTIGGDTYIDGNLRIDTPTPSVLGQVWTATDAIGNGSWQTPSGADTNFANTDLTFTVSRTHSMGANDLTLTGTGAVNTQLWLSNTNTGSRTRFVIDGEGTATSWIGFIGSTASFGSNDASYQNKFVSIWGDDRTYRQVHYGNSTFELVTDDDLLSNPQVRMTMNSSGEFGFGTAPVSGKVVTIGGNAQIDGDLNVDSNSLHVDSATNRVGIGRVNPTANRKLEVYGGGPNSSHFLKITHVGGGSGSTETGLEIEGSSNNKIYKIVTTNISNSLNRGQETLSIIDPSNNLNAIAAFRGGGFDSVGIATGNFPTGLSRGIVIKRGGAPTSDVGAQFSFYGQEVGLNNTAPHFRTEQGQVIRLYEETTAISAAAFVANTSGIADDSATYGGYTMGQVVAALQSIGLLQ